MAKTIQTPVVMIKPEENRKSLPVVPAPHATAYGRPRDFMGNRFVYLVVSPRARGLSIGVNLNPDKLCNFDCIYCEVDRSQPSQQPALDIDAMAQELRQTLMVVDRGQLRERLPYRVLPDELLILRHVAMSGDGEPTLAPGFAEAAKAIIHVRALGGLPFFKLVLMANGTGLDQPQVREGLEHFTRSDEIWIKLDGGTQGYLEKVDRIKVPIDKVLANILALVEQRPVVIQSLFAAINGEEPPFEEIEAYAHRLRDLKNAGAQISLVQIYSATRPMSDTTYRHLSLRTLSQIAQAVRQITGLRAEIF